ncbi:CP2 transcription factor [Aspergillus nomiae NRRL 13137]|uniref:CP2 transcription factor n=1 Tax=Aspergillus nomiae NRRL (strain ATCC 15546 / NRRL 13137 / CBS 260.88 / M93) TaxID=1509407 RepID=A0A0L1IZE8_ASPN3|nr:CP2 transcription factor [Aspergillus nomiae NRRL 13137]KNG84894.1 CP2 transcription factor [Aspergillus nomiae NRRL 13137]
MFGKRKTSQKPNEELIREFRNDFPYVFSVLSIAQTMHPEGLVSHAQPGTLQSAPWDEQPSTSTPANLLGFVSPPSQPHAVYTPLPDQMCAVLHSPAGDLHTPTVEWNLTSSPLRWTQMISAQTVRSQDDPPPANIATFPSLDPSPVFSNVDPFAPGLHASPVAARYFDHDHQEYVAPDECDRKDSFVASVRELSTDQSGLLTSNVAERASVHPEIPFRYHVILHAPTAMFDHARDIPVTYLNKAQAYTITIVDSRPPVAPVQPVQYRTRIGIAFEEPTHRSNPTLCWQLWHGARGGSDAERRGGRPCAVELVALKGGGGDTPDPAWHLESASFNQFCVSWTSGGEAYSSQCQILVRFHFLSTDFTQSKGVKGVPVRLCAKTERISLPEVPSEAETEAEICYCRVKVFRDHGAERKLANDVTHIQKSIERVEKQIARADYHGGGLGKKQKRRSVARGTTPSDPTRSMSRSPSVSTPGDLYKVLYDLQQLFSSALSVSVFALPGDEQDDPDQLASITLGNYPSSPANVTDVCGDADCDGPTEDGFPSRPSHSPTQTSAHITSKQATSADPPLVACFYVQIQKNSRPSAYYHALYLSQRTVRELALQLAKHARIDPRGIARVVHVKRMGLSIMVDDDVVQHLPEGQDLIASFVEIPAVNQDLRCQPRYEVQLTY